MTIATSTRDALRYFWPPPAQKLAQNRRLSFLWRGHRKFSTPNQNWPLKRMYSHILIIQNLKRYPTDIKKFHAISRNDTHQNFYVFFIENRVKSENWRWLSDVGYNYRILYFYFGLRSTMRKLFEGNSICICCSLFFGNMTHFISVHNSLDWSWKFDCIYRENPWLMTKVN